MIEMLQYAFIRTALGGTAAIGLVCAYLGVPYAAAVDERTKRSTPAARSASTSASEPDVFTRK